MLEHIGKPARSVPLHIRLVQLIRWHLITYGLSRSAAIEEAKQVLDHLVEDDLSEVTGDSVEQS
jgi:hypothetical protein